METRIEIVFGPAIRWAKEITPSANFWSARGMRRFLYMRPAPPRRIFHVILSMAVTMVASQAFPKAGPDYKPPTNNVPVAYKASEHGVWKEGQPSDGASKGRWWEVFNDPVLNMLQDRAIERNHDLKAAFQRVEQARSQARMSRAELLPNLSFNPSLRRERYSPNQEPSFGALTATTARVPLDLSYEIDLWGRVRRGFEASRASAQATLAAFQNVLLTLQGDVAQTYFSIRAIDAELDTVTRTVGLRKEQLQLVRSRFEGGIGNELDVARAETELATAESEAAALARRRVEYENALAALLGEFPSSFKLGALGTNETWTVTAPRIPAGLPSALLERRPDVAQAERELAAANARIGIAKASYFPVVTLTANGGYMSAEFDNLFDWSSRIWSIGPSISLPIFAQARNRANVARVRSAFVEATERYRSQVLRAFSEVENNLSAIHFLAEQAAAQERAVKSSQRAADLARERYQSGISSYLEVVDANRAALAAQRVRAQLTGQSLIAATQLIKALGGSWD